MVSGEPIRLVATDHADLHRLLEARALARLGVESTVAAAGDLVAVVRRLRPRAVLIDLATDTAAGLDAAGALTRDPDLGRIPVGFVLGSGQRADVALIDHMARAGGADVMALPLDPDDFYHHLGYLTGLPLRQDRRVVVDLAIELPGPRGVIQGHVVNASAGGLGIRGDVRLRAGEPLTVRLSHDGDLGPDTPTTVAWCQAVGQGAADGGLAGFAAGLRFDGEPPIRTRLLLEQVTPFDVVPTGDGATVVIHGDLTEMTNFAPLAGQLSGARWVELELSAVRYLSSAGVRSWCEMLVGLRQPYRFRHASVAFVSQAAMVPMVTGRGRVLSLEAPYLCERCDREELRLLEPSSIARDGDHFVPPRLRCRRCRNELVFDDVPDRYFALLTEP